MRCFNPRSTKSHSDASITRGRMSNGKIRSIPDWLLYTLNVMPRSNNAFSAACWRRISSPSGIESSVLTKTLAKGLGSGVPVGAVVAGPKAANIFAPGNHGSTFGGNPLAMRAGVETIRIMEEEGLLENAAKVGAHLKAGLQAALAAEIASGGVKEIRGQGLMLGIELSKPCSALMQRGVDHGLLISVTADTVVRLVPPLILTTAEADQIVAILCPLISALLKEAA